MTGDLNQVGTRSDADLIESLEVMSNLLDIPLTDRHRDTLHLAAARISGAVEHIAELEERIAARDRASLAALFLADAIGIENVEAEIEKARAAVTAPYLEQIAALQAEKTRAWGLADATALTGFQALHLAALADLDQVKREAAAEALAGEGVRAVRASTRPLPGKAIDMNSGSRSQWYAYGVEDSAHRLLERAATIRAEAQQ